MTETWRDNLPEELQNNATLGKFNTEADLANSYIELERRAGRSLTIPGEDATDEAWTKYYAKAQESGHLTVHPDHADDEHKAAFWSGLGVPEDSKDYHTGEGFEGLPEDQIENVRRIAKNAGWTKQQFKASLAEITKDYQEQVEAGETFRNEDKAIVVGRWGKAEEQKKTAISALVDKFQDPDHPIGDMNAAAYLMLDNIVKAFTGGGPQAFKQPDAGQTQYTPGELDSMISDITTKLTKEGRQMGKDKYNALLHKKHGFQKMRTASL